MKKLSSITKLSIIALFVSTLLFFRAEAATTPVNSNNILSSKTFVLAVEKDYPPFLYSENGELKGISYDYTKLVSDKMGYTLKTTEPLQLQQMLDAVKSGNANLLSDITKTPERQAYLEFSDPFIETPAVFVGRKNEDIKWSDNKSNENIKVAVGKGYGVVSYLKNKYPKANLIEFNSDTEVLEAVALGAVDVGALDESSLSYVLQKMPLSNIEIVGETGFNYSLSFAVAKENKAVIPLINQAIASITPQERSDIFSKWISSLPLERESDTQALIPNYVKYIALGLVIVILITLTIIVILRKIIKNKTLELQELNTKLDIKANKKVQEALDLANTIALQKSQLEDTKRAMINILEDVEDEKSVLKTLSKRLELATDGANMGVSEWDLESNSLVWNDKMYDLFGLDKNKIKNTAELLEQSRSVILPDDRKMTDKQRELEIKQGGKYDITFRVKMKDGSIRYLRAYGTTEKTGDKITKIYGINIDVTRDKEIDKAKTEFVSLASHQLRTPLTAIKWYAEILADEKKSHLSDDEKKYLKQIIDGNERMIELVNDLLNVSRLDLGTFNVEPKSTDLAKLAETITSDMTPQIETKHIKLTQKYDKDLPPIMTDPKLMRVVIENILSNAVKYTPEKGKVDINIVKDKDNFLISIKDDGMGIPEDQQKQIFTKLFRADNAATSAAEGTGLGLYMVKGIVENAGGKIWFESKENKGTTFFVEMPLKGMGKKEGGKKIEQST